MAEGLLRALASDRVEAFSAGSEPTRVHPLAIRALAERGIDAAHYRSKSVNEFADQSFDFAIALCAEEVCPVFLSAHTHFHWALPDPSAVQGGEEERLQAFRNVADNLTKRLSDWLIHL